MLNYEMCIKLKEALYPQTKGYYFIDNNYYIHSENHECIKRDDGLIGPWRDFVYRPTLSEIIDACGERKIIEEEEKGLVLWCFKAKRWVAGYQNNSSSEYVDDCPEPAGKGETPEEAVANLYLKIHYGA